MNKNSLMKFFIFGFGDVRLMWDMGYGRLGAGVWCRYNDDADADGMGADAEKLCGFGSLNIYRIPTIIRIVTKQSLSYVYDYSTAH